MEKCAAALCRTCTGEQDFSWAVGWQELGSEDPVCYPFSFGFSFACSWKSRRWQWCRGCLWQEAEVGGTAEVEGWFSGSETEMSSTGLVSTTDGDAERFCAFVFGDGGGAGEGSRCGGGAFDFG